MIAEPWEGNRNAPNYELGGSQPQIAEKPCCSMCGLHRCECAEVTATLQGGFPGIGWRQWNDKFRTTLRHFIKGDPRFVSDLMTRMYGSSDVFPDSQSEAYRPYQSLNYVSSHDGLTLYDLVSYNSDESWNCGESDGDTGITSDVMRRRKKQVKNFGISVRCSCSPTAQLCSVRAMNSYRRKGETPIHTILITHLCGSIGAGLNHIATSSAFSKR
jgi:hypothetical protein